MKSGMGWSIVDDEKLEEVRVELLSESLPRTQNRSNAFPFSSNLTEIPSGKTNRYFEQQQQTAAGEHPRDRDVMKS